MKFVLITGLAVATAFGWTSSASADGHKSTVKHFHGFYAGAQMGYGLFDAAFELDADTSSGLTYGGFAGYRHQTKSGWVFGLEGALGDQSGALVDLSASVRLEVKYDYLW